MPACACLCLIASIIFSSFSLAVCVWLCVAVWLCGCGCGCVCVWLCVWCCVWLLVWLCDWCCVIVACIAQAPTQQTTQLNSVTQLVDVADFDQFCTTYKDFNVVDLWLYTEDVDCLNNVAKQGLQVATQAVRGSDRQLDSQSADGRGLAGARPTAVSGSPCRHVQNPRSKNHARCRAISGAMQGTGLPVCCC